MAGAAGAAGAVGSAVAARRALSAIQARISCGTTRYTASGTTTTVSASERRTGGQVSLNGAMA
ncbi:hypothetical protein [Microbacterium barkeri]|uniref:hypothetical protein n=1 Tax=Microbacterium barkeri TaxID=33917 RepID=UPI0030149CE1